VWTGGDDMGILRPLTYDASLQLGFLFGEEIGLLTDLQREVYHIDFFDK
jgi:hypothetical protein